MMRKTSGSIFIGRFMPAVSAILVLLLTTAAEVHAQARRIHVKNANGGAAAPFDKADFSNAASTIRDALAFAKNGDTIILSDAGGTYVENDLIITQDNLTIVSEDFDGFGGCFVTTPLIDGNSAGNSIFKLVNRKNVTIAGIDITRGFDKEGGAIHCNNCRKIKITCINFNANKATELNGGAIFFKNTDGSIDECSFTNNRAVKQGGAISIFNPARKIGTVNMFCNQFADNVSEQDSGGAVFVAHATVNMSPFNSFFQNKSSTLKSIADHGPAGVLSAAGSGGAIGCGLKSKVDISQASFFTNVARRDGGGVFGIFNAVIKISDSDFTQNEGLNDAGAVYFTISSKATLRNNFFLLNVTTGNGGGVHATCTSIVTLDDCNFIQNSAGGNGGGVDIRNATVNLLGGFLGENVCTNDGGGVFVSTFHDRFTQGGTHCNTKDGNLFVQGTAISENIAGGANSGGGISAVRAARTISLLVDGADLQNNVRNGIRTINLNKGLSSIVASFILGSAESGIRVTEPGKPRGAASTLTISGNTIDGGLRGILLDDVVNCLIQGNDISDAAFHGIRATNNTFVTIDSRNTFSANRLTGVIVANSSFVRLDDNDFLGGGVTVAGILVDDTSTAAAFTNNITGHVSAGAVRPPLPAGTPDLDFRDNWWGDRLGPRNANNPFNATTTGDRVIGQINFGGKPCKVGELPADCLARQEWLKAASGP